MIEVSQNEYKLLASYRMWTLIHLQVMGADTIYIADTRQELQQIGPGGTSGGLQITNLPGIVSLWWFGDLWATASAPMVRVVLMGISSPPPLNVRAGQYPYGTSPGRVPC